MKKLSNQELNQRMYSRAADRATNELEENTVWAMAEVHSSADEAIEELPLKFALSSVILESHRDSIIGFLKKNSLDLEKNFLV